jgi:hypothetical protein
MTSYGKLLRQCIDRLPINFREAAEKKQFGLTIEIVETLLSRAGIRSEKLAQFLRECSVSDDDDGYYLYWLCILDLEELEYWNFRCADYASLKEKEMFIVGRDESCCPVAWNTNNDSIAWVGYAKQELTTHKTWHGIENLFEEASRMIDPA